MNYYQHEPNPAVVSSLSSRNWQQQRDEAGSENKKFESDNNSDDLNDDGRESSDGTGTKISGSGRSDILAQIRVELGVGFQRSITW